MEKNNSYSLTTFNSDGRLTQTDYASIAVSVSVSIIALKSKNSSVVLAKINSDITVSDTSFTSRIFIINNKIGIAGAGLYPDLKLIIKRARRQAKLFQSSFGEEISTRQLTKELAAFIQEFTQSGGVRVFGISLFLIGFDLDGPVIYQINPSGSFLKIKGGAIGTNANTAIELLKKRLSKILNFQDLFNTALLTLQEVSDVPLSKLNINFAGIINENNFKIFSFEEIEILLKKKKAIL
nr:proteasome A-type subunit-like protein [Cryptomonas curvata]|mmetsp:Transcript_12010/g.25818  ORF Transcript_12010/g.25818 Transcript_12010/m.25818 type:complete len:238 (+) Transcript_12010:219-932(+)